MQVEFVLLVLSLLFFASIFTDKIGFKYGVPALLLFLSVGMLFGPEGIFSWFGGSGIYKIGVGPAQAIGTIALCVILFSGGMDTKISDIHTVIAPGVTLATIGVLLTCAITGVLIYYIFGWFNFNGKALRSYVRELYGSKSRCNSYSRIYRFRCRT